MKNLRLSAGIVLMLAGAAGLIISLIAIYAIHQASTSASQQTAMFLDSTGEAVVFLRRGTTKIQNLLTETKMRILALEGTLDDVETKLRNSKTDRTPLDDLDERVAMQLQRAQATVASLHSTLDGFQNALVLFNSISKFTKSSSLDDQKDGDDGQELAKSLIDASEILDRISRFLNDFLTDREMTKKNVGELLGWVKQIQDRLEIADTRVGVFQQRLSLTTERISFSRKTIPTSIESAGAIAIVLLISFAFTQIGLMLQARMLLRKCAPIEPEPRPTGSAT